MEVTPSFGQWLKARRRSLGLTQDALGEQVGCAGETVRKIEAGGVRPSMQLAQLLASHLDLSPEERVAFVKWARGASAPEAFRLTEGYISAPIPLPLHAGTAPGSPFARGSVATTSVIPAAPPGQFKADGAAQKPENPYKGLRAFQEADAADFFGRQVLTSRLLARLGESTELARFLAVVGPSGSGKSSVVRAGLLPAIRAGALPGSQHWPVVQITPGAQPLEELEAALLRISVNPPESLRRQLTEDQRGLLRAVKRVLPEDPSVELFLLIDQFEELFTLLSVEAERVYLLDSLYVAVADPSSRLRVVITLRADFYDRPLQYGQIGELLRSRSELVLPMPAEDLEQAIVEPAGRAGVGLESELLASLLADTAGEPGTLPLLQYTLTELFERRAHSRLTLAAYRASGGLHGALAQRAEEIYGSLTESEQQLARQLFLRLVTLGEGTEDTRRRMLLEEVASLGWNSESVTRVIEQFAQYRLVTLDRDLASGGPTVEVAHEALLQAWGRLREWLDEAREHLRIQRRLLTAANEWIASGEDPSFLASGSRLGQFQMLSIEAVSPRGVALNELEQRFLEESLEEEDRREAAERERQERELKLAQQTAEAARRAAGAQKSAASRLRILVAALALFLLVAAGLSAWALGNAQTAQTALTGSVAARLAAEATSLLNTTSDRQLIALLSIRSLRTQYSLEGEEALWAATTLDYPVRTFRGNQGSVSQIAFSPDGRYVITGDLSGHAQLWDADTGKQLQSAGGTHAWELVNAAAFSPDSKTVLLGAGFQTAPDLWDVQTGKELRQFGYRLFMTMNAVTFTPDGKQVVAGGGYFTATENKYTGEVDFFDEATGRTVLTYTYPLAINMMAFSPDGKQLAVAGYGAVSLLDATTGHENLRMQPYGGAVGSIAFSPDGKQLLVSGNDDTASLLDAGSGQEIHRLTGHTGVVVSAVFSRDGKTILTTSQDRTARLWDVATGKETRRFVYNQEFLGGNFSSNGQSILTVSQDGAIELWNIARPFGLREFPGYAGYFSADSKLVVTFDRDTTHLWDAASGQEKHSFSLPLSTGAWALTSDNKYLARGSADSVRLWDAQSGAAMHTYPNIAYSLAIAPDGKYLLAGTSAVYQSWFATGAGGTASILDAVLGGNLFDIRRPSVVLSVAISPDGHVMFTGEGDGTAHLWDPDTAKEIRALTGHTGAVISIAVSPDGQTVVTGSDDRTACLWSVQTGARLRCLQGHSDRVELVGFSDDGQRVLTGSPDGTARIWDAQTGAELRRFSARAVGADQAAFSPNGRYVLTASENQVTLRDADYQAAIGALCNRLNRDFTAQERQQYSITGTEPTCPAR